MVQRCVVSSQSSPKDDASPCHCLQALGAVVSLGPQSVERCIQETGMGFMFAPR